MVVLAFALEQLVLGHEATRLGGGIWQAFPVTAIEPETTSHAGRLALGACGALETASLGWLLLRWRKRPPDAFIYAALGVGTCALLATALGSRVSLSADMYAYIGYAKLPSLDAAYHPGKGAVAPAFAAVGRLWGDPLVPAVYGPAWLVLVRAWLWGSTTLGDAVVRLRLLDVGAFLVLGYALARARTAPAIVGLYALNPGLVRIFIADAHNDIVGMALLVAGAAIMTAATGRPARRAAGTAVLLAASMMKLPFLAVALLCMAKPGNAPRRLGIAALFAAASIALQILWTHGAYVAALGDVAATNTAGGTLRVLHVLAGAAALGCVGASLAVRARWRVGAWILPTTAANLYPWYLGWSLPYLFAIGRGLGLYLVALPLLTLSVGTFSPSSGYAVLGGFVVFALSTDRRDAAAARGGPV